MGDGLLLRRSDYMAANEAAYIIGARPRLLPLQRVHFYCYVGQFANLH